MLLIYGPLGPCAQLQRDQQPFLRSRSDCRVQSVRRGQRCPSCACTTSRSRSTASPPGLTSARPSRVATVVPACTNGGWQDARGGQRGGWGGGRGGRGWASS